MKCAVVVPTCNRPNLLIRALQTFEAASSRAFFEVSRIVIADDSASPEATLLAIDAVKSEAPQFAIDHVLVEKSTAATRGPGNTRNVGLRYIVDSGVEHDGVIMFDDDISFRPCTYQSNIINSQADDLFSEISRMRDQRRTIIGCGYSGRQDLSLLEHLSLVSPHSSGAGALASTSRMHFEHEAPSGVSGAFVFAFGHASGLPFFLPWYNEDYFWLRCLAASGWKIQQSKYVLAHAPEDGLNLTFQKLEFEQYGEALWWAIQNSGARLWVENLQQLAVRSLDNRVEEFNGVLLAMNSKQDSTVFNEYTSILQKAKAHFRSLKQQVEQNSKHDYVLHLREVMLHCGISG